MAGSGKLSQYVTRVVDELSDGEIKELHTAHTRLNPRDSRKEDRKEWVEKHTDREKIIRKWAAWFEDQFQEIQEKTGENKSDVRNALAKKIRIRQKALGESSYLMNPVKITLLATFVDYMENPGKLEVSPDYKPRSGSGKLEHKQSLFADDNFSLKAKPENNYVVGTISNESDRPMQSLRMQIMQSDGTILVVSSALGENFEVASGEVHIPFMKASMDNNPKHVDFKIEINAFYDFSSGFKIKLFGEDTTSKEEVTRTYDFSS